MNPLGGFFAGRATRILEKQNLWDGDDNFVLDAG
jgi:hypothetical protein